MFKSALQIQKLSSIAFGIFVIMGLMTVSNNSFAQSCNNQLAHWSLNSCSPGTSYNEFNASVNKPTGFQSVSASKFTNEGQHSCTPGVSGVGVCHDIKLGCSFSDNNSNAFKFSVTIAPQSGYEVKLSKLTFYERAPLNFTWVSGTPSDNDNDPPSKYGWRILKNGTEIGQWSGKSTSQNWSLESFDFSSIGLNGVTVSSQTTFSFELLGYCRSNGTSGRALWDVDEVKIFGCSTPITPPGVCDNVTSLRKVVNLASSCNGGANRVMYVDGGLFYQEIGDLYFVEYNNNTAKLKGNVRRNGVTWAVDVDFSGRNSNQSGYTDDCSNDSQIGSWYYYNNFSGTVGGTSISDRGHAFQIGNGANGKNSNNGASGWFTFNGQDADWNFDLSAPVPCTDNNNNGIIDACESTPSPCAGQGGDSDGDGVCNNQDCRPNDPNISNQGDACDDGNSNTANDQIQADCSCQGTTTPPSGCNAVVSVDNGKIKVTGLSGSWKQVIVANSQWQNVFECNNFGGTACGSMPMYTPSQGGTYYVTVKSYSSSWTTTICDIFQTVTVGGTPPPNPCAGQGGDSDGDGVCNNQDCRPNDPNISNEGDACNDGNSNTSNDQIQADCSCQGTTNPPSPCAGQGGDSDGDGVCNNQDCRPNDPNISNEGDACNDGNSNTTNDQIQADCSCQGTTTPPPPGGCNATVSVSGNTITVNNLTGTYKEVNFLNANWQSVGGCSSWGSDPCGAAPSYTAPAGGTYYVLIKSYTSSWSVICNATETVDVGGTPPPPPGVCSVDASVSNIQCNDRGTATQSDDTYSFTVTATITNGGLWGYDIQGTNKVGIANGTSTTISGVLISGGSRTYKVFDHDDPNCFKNITVTPPAPCSSGNPTFDCPALGKNIGDSCNDGDPNTTDDTVQSNCTCAGTPTGGGNCNATITASGNKVTVSGLSGAFKQVIVSDASWNTVFSCDSWGGTACGNSPMYTATSAGTYYVTVKTYNAAWINICDKFETVNLTGGNTGGCNNVTNGGQIAGAQSNCGGYNPGVISSSSLPSGGSGAIEYIWLSSTSGCPTLITQAIPGANASTYNPGYISQTTWYRRCSRRAGCTGNNSWYDGESNCIKKEVRTCGATVCATRSVMNSRANCGSGAGYGFFAQDWIYGAGGLNNAYDFQNGSFIEYTDGTAKLTGTAVNLSNSNVQFAVDVTFSGRTNSGGGKSNPACNIVPQNDWYYYSTTTGTLSGQSAVAGANVNITRDMEPFQLGTGANFNDRWNFGASGWLKYTIVSQPNNSAIQIQGGGKRLDFNIRLSGNAAPCAPYTSRQQANNALDVVVKNGSDVQLSWTNDTGFKNDLFEIERSKDGNTWESIGTVETLSLDDTPKFYRSMDANPFLGFNYYRVKVNYLDGSEDFTEVKRITIADVEDFGLFPNPAQGTVNVSLKGYEGKDIEIQVVDQFGKKIQTVRLNNVTDSSHQIELNRVQNGIYSLWIFTDGRKPIGKKMIVNKLY